MDFELSAAQEEIVTAVDALCARFDADYWRDCDAEGAFPEAFVSAIVEAGWLGIAMPEGQGGAGLDHRGNAPGPRHRAVRGGHVRGFRRAHQSLRPPPRSGIWDGRAARAHPASIDQGRTARLFRRDRTRCGPQHYRHHDHGDADDRGLRRARTQDVDINGPVRNAYPAARSHNATRRCGATHRRG